jgi:HTH-type transcriptional regulator/antitoxin HigA
MLRSDGTPIIALTIRHDRLDNFWFTLFHELMHVIHHLSTDNESRLSTGVFLDDLDVTVAISDVEAEADNLAREALIPPRHWEHSAVRYVVAPLTVQELARQASVSDAIVAGRVRFERRNYRLLSQMIGAGRVRGLFPEVDWQFVER